MTPEQWNPYLPTPLSSSCWWEHDHKPTDTFEKLSPDKMRGIVEVVLSLVQHLDDLTAARGKKWERPPNFERHEALSAGRLLGSKIPAQESALQEATSRIIGMLAGDVPR